MKVQKNLTLRICILSLLTSLFASCATTLNVDVERPGKLNLTGLETIAVLPFDECRYGSVTYKSEVDRNTHFEAENKLYKTQDELISYIQNSLESGLFNSKYISLIDPTVVKSALKYDSELTADAYISGEVVSLKVRDFLSKDKTGYEYDDYGKSDYHFEYSSDKKYPDDDYYYNNQTLDRDSIIQSGGPKDDYSFHYSFSTDDKKDNSSGYNFTFDGNNSSDKIENESDLYVKREVSFIFNYEIVDGKTKTLIGHDTINIQNVSGPKKEIKELPSVYSMVVSDIDRFVRNILHDIQPYTVNKDITLLQDKTKNEDMKQADKLASKGYYTDSYNLFMKVYNETKSVESGYNAAMLLIAMGKLNDAEALLSTLYDETFDVKVKEALDDVRYEIKQSKKVQEQVTHN